MDADKDFDVFKAYASDTKKKEASSRSHLTGSRSHLSEHEKESFGNKDVLDMLKKMKKMHRELELKLDDSYQKMGLNPRSIKEFLENSSNFTSEEWSKIQVQRLQSVEKLEREFGVAIKANEGGGSTLKISRGQTINISSTSESSPAKDRKSKTRGARHNWIPMR